MPLEPDDLVTNRQQRCPVVLALDASSSMHDTRIDTLNKTLSGFKDELVADPVAALRVELAVIRFDSTATLIQDFVTARNFEPPVLQANGTTAMGEAVNIALDQIEARKQRYRETGIQYYRPWLWLMSDGMPNDNWEAAAARAVAAEQAKKVSVFAVGIGDNANLAVLSEFSGRPAVRVQPGMFARMFEWLSASLQARSKSVPAETTGEDGAAAATTTAGEQVKFDPIDWGTQD